jgi:hypothetical protein
MGAESLLRPLDPGTSSRGGNISALKLDNNIPTGFAIMPHQKPGTFRLNTPHIEALAPCAPQSRRPHLLVH